MNKHIALTVSLILGACAAKPLTAKEACASLEQKGLASGCHEETPGAISALASSRFDFKLPSVPGKNAAVMTFDSDEAFQKTVKAYEAAAFFAGPHRYGNAAKRVFVQANDELSMDEGRKLKAAVEAL